MCLSMKFGSKKPFGGKNKGPGGKRPGGKPTDRSRAFKDGERAGGKPEFKGKTGFKGKPGFKNRDDSVREDKPAYKPRGEFQERDSYKKDSYKKDGPRKDGFKKTGFKGKDGFKKDSFRKDRPDNRGPRPERERLPPEPREAAPYVPDRERATIYGLHAVTEAWLNPDRIISALYITPPMRTDFEPVLVRARAAGISRPSPTLLDKDKLDRYAPRDAVHQGIALAAEPLDEQSVADFLRRVGDAPDALFVMLDQVTDPHNVGAIIRSASALGADGLILQRKHAPSLTGVLAKTASGGLEHLPVATETNLSRALEELKEAGFFAFGLDERGTQSITEIKRGGRVVLVLGAEGSGLRPLVREHCDSLVRLPTSGPIQSLNVSNAAAVALFALSAKI